jgi:hypothetical protein
MCKKISKKNLTKKKLWILKWPKMSHILIIPCNNHFWVDFKLNFLNMYIKFFYLEWLFFIWVF